MTELEQTLSSGTSDAGAFQDYAIETKSLTKAFSGREAVSDLSLRVPVGSIFGFLGPNGSGKTTTIRMMLGLVSSNKGDITILGQPVEQLNQLARVGVVVEGPGFYPYLSGIDNLQRFAEVSYPAQKRLNPETSKLRRPDILQSLERVGLVGAKDKKYRAYSLGMKQRLSIAAALMWPRDLLVLDEPTNGLDPQGIVEVRELITSLNQEGMTIFVSSHILSEVEMICSHIAIMRDGVLQFQGSVEDFKGSLSKEFSLVTSQVDLAKEILVRFEFIDLHSCKIEGNHLTAQLSSENIEEIVKTLVEQGVGIRSVGLVEPSLEDAFVALTGRSSNVS